MKIALEQLASQLKDSLSPLYLLSGDVPLLLQESVSAIRTKAKQLGYDEHYTYTVNAQLDWSELTGLINAYTLFSSKRVIELQFSATVNAATGKQLQQLCTTLNDSTILIAQFPKLDSKTQQTAWFRQIEKSAVFIPIWPIESGRLPGWLKQRLQQFEIILDNASLQLLADAVDGNLLAAAQTIEKMYLTYGKGKLSLDQVEASLTDQARFDVFQLVEQCMLGQADKVIRILQSLKQTGNEPILMVWALAREIRLLLTIFEQQQQGKSLDQCFRDQGIWEKRKPPLRAALQRFSYTQWQTLLGQLSTVDRQIKGIAVGNHWITLEQFCLHLTGRRLFSHAYN